MLDQLTVSAMTALVVTVSGVLFVLETLIRRDEGAGRVWSVGFLAAMLTTIAYIVAAVRPDAWWVIAVGNATFVGGTGLMWLGCRRFNGRRMAAASLSVVVVSVVVAGAAAADGADGGEWAGALWMFAGLVAFAGLGAVECLRGAMAPQRTAWGLAVVLGAESLFYAARIPVFLLFGPESPAFQVWFSTDVASILTVALTIVAVVVTSVLRAGRAVQRGYRDVTNASLGLDGILPHSTFLRALREVLARAERRGERIGVLAVQVEDLPQISTAFGSEIALSVTDAWRSGVRRYAPSLALAGEDGQSGLLVAVTADSTADARRQAALLYAGLFEDLGAVAGGVIPVVGVGVALSSSAGYDVESLVRVAREAAHRAAQSVGSSVLVGEAE